MPYAELDAPTKVLILTAFELAWARLGDSQRWSVARRVDATKKVAGQLIAAAEAGERDCDRLVRAALDGVDRAQ
jgi:hypothetical protein